MSKLRFRQIQILAQSFSTKKDRDITLSQHYLTAKAGLLGYSTSSQKNSMLENYHLLIPFSLIFPLFLLFFLQCNLRRTSGPGEAQLPFDKSEKFELFCKHSARCSFSKDHHLPSPILE